jgi:hypothetical protein
MQYVCLQCSRRAARVFVIRNITNGKTNSHRRHMVPGVPLTSASQRRGNLVRSCGIISRIDISQNPQPPHLPIYSRPGRSITVFTSADPGGFTFSHTSTYLNITISLPEYFLFFHRSPFLRRTLFAEQIQTRQTHCNGQKIEKLVAVIKHDDRQINGVSNTIYFL